MDPKEMPEIMDAETARQKSRQARTDKAIGCLKSVMSVVEKAIFDGETHCHINAYIHRDVKALLEENGYTVKDESNQIDGCMTRISWE